MSEEYYTVSQQLKLLYDVWVRLRQTLVPHSNEEHAMAKRACETVMEYHWEHSELNCPAEDKCPGELHFWKYKLYKTEPRIRSYYYKSGLWDKGLHPDMRHCPGIPREYSPF